MLNKVVDEIDKIIEELEVCPEKPAFLLDAQIGITAMRLKKLREKLEGYNDKGVYHKRGAYNLNKLREGEELKIPLHPLTAKAFEVLKPINNIRSIVSRFNKDNKDNNKKLTVSLTKPYEHAIVRYTHD